MAVVDQINQEFEKLASLTDEELRGKTAEFKLRIADATKDIKTSIDELRAQLANIQSADEKHSLHDEIDGYEDQLTDKYEEILYEILPEAFAVVKETCSRFVGNHGCCR